MYLDAEGQQSPEAAARVADRLSNPAPRRPALRHDDVVMYDSPEAASIRTVVGWFSRTGHFWGDDEHMARYDGSTHKNCTECGAVIANNSFCAPCHREKEFAAFRAMSRAPWDGVSPLYSEKLQKFFFHEEFHDYIAEGMSEEDLMLILCEPTHLHEIDTDEWQDEFPDDGDDSCITAEVSAALDALNAAIRKAPPASWTPKGVAAELPLKPQQAVSSASEVSAEALPAPLAPESLEKTPEARPATADTQDEFDTLPASHARSEVSPADLLPGHP